MELTYFIERIEDLVINTFMKTSMKEFTHYITVGENVHYKVTIKRIKKLPEDEYL